MKIRAFTLMASTRAAAALLALSATSVSMADIHVQGRHLVEMIHAVAWPGVTIWTFEASDALSRSIQVANSTGDRIVITDGHGRFLRSVKPGLTIELRASQCGGTGVLAVAPGVGRDETLIECANGRYYHVKSRQSTPDHQEDAR